MRVGKHDGESGIETGRGLMMQGAPARAAVTQTVSPADRGPDHDAPGRRVNSSRWWVLAGVSAVVLTILTVAGVRLVTRPSGVVDQIVILTVPSGADVKFDSRELGRSPVKLEDVGIGTHRIEISKDDYETIVWEANISEPQNIEIKLKPLHPGDASWLSPEERIEQYKQLAEEAFSRSYYAIPYDGSALYFANLILDLKESNQYGHEMKERVQKALHQTARNASSRRDLAQAQEIYDVLVEHYPDDQAARAGRARLQSQLAARRGELLDLVRSAEMAMKSGNLIEPSDASAYYYSRQALAIDPQNAQANSISSRIKNHLLSKAEGRVARGEIAAAIRGLEEIARLFPEDRQILTRLQGLESVQAENLEKAKDPGRRREQGLAKYSRQDYVEAIPELEFAAAHDLGTSEVIFALGFSYLKTGNLERASHYLRKVPLTEPNAHRSAIAALGEVAFIRGDVNTALERYREARELGGSTIYSITELDAKIERIEKGRREKESEPAPLSIVVTHLHGGLFRGSCKGVLGVSSTGVRFDGEDTYAAGLLAVTDVLANNYLEVRFHNKPQKFKASKADAQRFHDALTRYQAHASKK